MLEMNAMIAAYLEYGMSKQLREKTLLSYEQRLRLFAAWLEEQMGICDAEEIWDLSLLMYICLWCKRDKLSFWDGTDTELRKR